MTNPERTIRLCLWIFAYPFRWISWYLLGMGGLELLNLASQPSFSHHLYGLLAGVDDTLVNSLMFLLLGLVYRLASRTARQELSTIKK